MHELALSTSIAKIVTRNADGRRVRCVQLRVGALRQVVPETLAYCWSIATRGGPLDGSVLDIEFVPAQVECDECGAWTTLGRLTWNCQGCGGSQVHVVAGEEFLVVSIDVDT